MKVYVAAASSDILRVEHWIKQLEDNDIEVTCTWTKTVRSVGDANPRTANQSQRAVWAKKDLDEVRSSNVFWLLLPGEGVYTSGAWVELGAAFETGRRRIVMSGDNASIFTGLADEKHNTDQIAFESIKALSKLSP